MSTNQIAKTIQKINALPGPLRRAALTLAARRLIPIMGSTGIRVEELTPARAQLFLPNRKRVQNHIKGVAAGAMMLMAEIASGLVVAQNVGAQSVPVLQGVNMEFKKRAKGAMTAVAELGLEQAEEIRAAPKGETLIRVRLTDETGKEPCLCEMRFAWTPKRR